MSDVKCRGDLKFVIAAQKLGARPTGILCMRDERCLAEVSISAYDYPSFCKLLLDERITFESYPYESP